MKKIYFSLSMLEISKIVMYEFWYSYAKQKYRKKSKLFYMVIDNFVVYIKTLNMEKKKKKGKLCYMDVDNFVVYIKI